MDDIYKLTPIDHAIATIDMTITKLRRWRNELEAQLPERQGLAGWSSAIPG